MEGPHSTSRRGFLQLVAAGLGTTAALSAGALGLGFLYPVPRDPPPPRYICLRSALRRGEPLELLDPYGRKVLLVEKEGGELMAISTVCTHLGCSVFYRPERNVFECPCHDGRFDGDGAPVSGPPTRALPRYEVQVRENKVFVRFV